MNSGKQATGPGFKTCENNKLSNEFLTDYHHTYKHKVERLLVCVEGRGRISQSGLTQDIKMGSYVFQCDVPCQCIAQHVGPVSVCCDGVVCHVLCLRHGISVWLYIGQSTTATSRHRRDMTLDVKMTLNPKQTNLVNKKAACIGSPSDDHSVKQSPISAPQQQTDTQRTAHLHISYFNSHFPQFS